MLTRDLLAVANLFI